MKRSTQVTLVLMGAVGIGGTAYALSPGCPQPPPGAPASEQTCRSGHVGGHGGWFHSGPSSSTYFGSSGGAPVQGAPTPAVSTVRGGFGGFGGLIGRIGA
jgi:hypothetical protein